MLLSITVKNVNVVGRIESDLPELSNHWRKTKSNQEKHKKRSIWWSDLTKKLFYIKF
jgi:hypothetical protein